MATQKERSSSNGSLGTTPTPPPTSGLQTEEGTATRPAAESTETPGNEAESFDPNMMEKFFSFMSFYEQHQQAAPAQSNNSDNNNNRATPMSHNVSSYARGNQQQPTFAPYEPQRGSISFAPQPQSSLGQEKTLDALQPPKPSRAACTGPSRPTCLSAAPTVFPPTTAIPLTAPMASPPVLAFDAEGRPVKFETWLDDLHLFLQLTAKDDISLYDHALGHTTAPAATADSTARSQWQTRDAHARFAIRNSLPIDEREHFGQHKTAQALYTAVVARYSSPASAALGRLSLPYLFPDLASFHTVADLITHLRTSEARFRATMPDEDHFLARCPTELTIALLEKELLAAEASIVAVGASRGDPRTPFFAGCSPSPLLPSVASAAAVDLLSAEKVGTASASSGRRRGKGKGGKGGGGDSGGGGAGGGGGGGGGSGATGGAGSSGGGGGGSGWGGGRGGGCGGGGGGRGGGRGWGGRGGGSGGGGRGGTGGGQGHQHSPSPQEPCGGPHATQRCFARLNDAWRVQFPQATELPRWVDLLKKRIDIYALDFDAILTAMYVMSTSGEGAEYLCVPPDPGIRTSASAAPGTRVSATPGAGEAAALGACASAPPGTESTAALHTFTLDSGASRCFFRDRTALEPLARPVAVSLADPSGGPVIATSSTVLPCPAVPSGTLSGLHLPSFSTNLVAGCALQDGGVHQFTPAYERVTHCTCARTGRHLAIFTRQPGSGLYTLTTGSPQVAASASASASGQLSAPCSCRSLAHETVLWHHRLGHPSVQRLRAMHSRYLRAAPHSSSFPPTTAPLQTLHMDVWGPARVRGQGQERYFLIVVDDYSRYTTVFPLRTKGEVPDVLIPWICRARLQLSERFHSDFPVLRLHSDRGGEFSSDLLAAYCAEHGIEQSFTLPASPQQNGVAERRIGLVMEVARTSLIHAAAPHFLWPFAVRYAAHQLNLWPRVSLPETSPTLLWTGEVGDASRFRVWGSRAFVRDLSADKLSSRAVPCVFLGFVPDAPGSLKLRQIDVANAFLYAPVDAEIFVELPHGSNADPNQVCQLEKSLYGIKQAPRLWQQHLHARLIRIGFLQLPHDQGMYQLTKGTNYILLIVYVDNLLYIGSTDAITTRFEGELQRDLTLTVATTVTQYLGLNIQDGDNAIYLSAEKYKDTIAKRFRLTPTVISMPYRYTDENRKASALLKPAGIRDYQRKLGCLLFAAVTCRPDLSYSASQLATYLKKPEAEHMLELDRALHYLVSTPTIGLTYHKTGTTTPKLIGYVDADHAGDSDNRRSRTGYIYRLKPIGPISWQSNKQELIALSSAEAEYIALCSATKEGLYLCELLEEAKLAQLPSFSLFCDNQSAIRIANKNGFANRTKHIALRYFFVKDEIEKGRLELSYCPTSEMAADYLTKKLGKQNFEYYMLLTGQGHVISSDTPEEKGSVGNK
ncbi:unnamed protein product [Closterium sp. NIES-54]